MKVMHIAAANSTAGGGEKHVADCLREMSLRGIDLALVAPVGGDLETLARELGVAFYPAPIDHGIAAPRTSIVRNAISDFDPDIIHAHGHRAALFARRADDKASQRVVYTFHGIHVDKGVLSPAKILLEKMLLPRTAAFVATCKADEARALRLKIAEASKIHVVYNGIPAPKTPVAGLFRSQHNIAPDEALILSVGRISKPKNWPGMLRIFEKALVRAEQMGAPRLRLVMICPGTPEQQQELAQLVSQQPHAQQITLLPRQEDLSGAYHDADVFALASLWEARAYVIVEALSYGTPVVGYDIDGSAEAVDTGKSGLLVPRGDEESFAAALVTLITEPSTAHAYGSYGAREMMRRFSIDTMINQLLTLYSSVQNI